MSSIPQEQTLAYRFGLRAVRFVILVGLVGGWAYLITTAVAMYGAP